MENAASSSAHRERDEIAAQTGISDPALIERLTALDGLVIAVPHQAYRKLSVGDLLARVKKGGAVVDVKSMLEPSRVPAGVGYWSV